MARTPERAAKLGKQLDFEELESFRFFCKEIMKHQVDSLKYFRSTLGFKHVENQPDTKTSVSSSATCVLSLAAPGAWEEFADKKQSLALLTELVSRTKSAGLDANNPFTNAWVLEALSALEGIYPERLSLPERAQIEKKEKRLQRQIRAGGGGVSIKPGAQGTTAAGYPPSGYLTQLVVRTLRRRDKLGNLTDVVKGWAWAELARELALVQAKSKTQDAFAVAYLLILVTMLTPRSAITPQQSSIQRSALKTFFRCQLKDGTWPLSRPLFHYPNFGNAYCYEYEMLTQLLGEPDLRELLFDYLPNLRAVADAASNNVYRLQDKIMVWNSGHHPNQAEPESWATASVYHFFYELDRFLAESVRRKLFRYLELPPPSAIGKAQAKEEDFARDFLDSELNVDDKREPLKRFLWKQLVRPVANEADAIGRGRQFDKRTPRAAIFFGPPGTSKTELSQEIANFLGWPLLAIDPSRLLRKGMDGIQAEANTIFRMLEWTEQVVVLFDEFDELVRERGSSGVETFSRFLTTAMLPKLASIHKRRTLVFIFATNNISDFDLAIRRQGRFDHVIQIMPPTYQAKIARSSGWGRSKINIMQKFDTVGLKVTPEIKKQLGDLTFGECEDFATEVVDAIDAETARHILKNRWQHCTLRMRVPKSKPTKNQITWKERCALEAENNK